MKEDEKKLFEKIKKNTEIEYGPNLILTSLLKKLKKHPKISCDKFTDLEKGVLSLIYSNLYDTFFKNETMKSLKTPMIAPLIIKNNELPVLSFLKNNKLNFKNCIIFAIHDNNNQIFYWNDLSALKILCKNLENLYFCKYKTITNVNTEMCDKLSLWFRSMIFYNNLEYKRFKSSNLLFFDIPVNNNKFTFCTIGDFGIKDPKLTNEIKSLFELIFAFISNDTRKHNKSRTKRSKVKKRRISSKDKLVTEIIKTNKIHINPINLFKISYEIVKERNKKIISFKKFTILEKGLLNILNKNMCKYFYENENIKSLETKIMPPMMIKDDGKKNQVICYKKNNKLVFKDCFVFGIHNRTKKKFYWFGGYTLDVVCKDRTFNFCKYNCISDVNDQECYLLAIWYRTMFYYYKLKYRSAKTNNLLIFEITEVDGDEIILYTLSDYGIKDPIKNKHIKDTFDQIDVINSIHHKDQYRVKNRTNNRVKRRTIKNRKFK